MAEELAAAALPTASESPTLESTSAPSPEQMTQEAEDGAMAMFEATRASRARANAAVLLDTAGAVEAIVDVALDEAAIQKLFGVPMGFVKGGTTTSGHDRLIASNERDAERRRDESDEEKRIAKEHGLASGDANHMAARGSYEFTDHPEIKKAYVPLQYMERNGREVAFKGTGDIIMPGDPMFPNELALLIFCPKCKETGLPAGQCILTIRQGNRKWHLDTRKGGELFVEEDGTPQRSAGVIMDSERFTCANCSWAARIDNNKVIPA